MNGTVTSCQLGILNLINCLKNINCTNLVHVKDKPGIKMMN